MKALEQLQNLNGEEVSVEIASEAILLARKFLG